MTKTESKNTKILNASRQRRRRVGDGDQVQVVGHQTVAEQAELFAAAELAQAFEVEAAVVVEQEDVLAIVAALGDVMGAAWDDDARLARHGRSVPRRGTDVNRNPRLSPVFLPVFQSLWSWRRLLGRR